MLAVPRVMTEWANDDGRHLGSLGALISILAFGLSPLTQQVIAYPSRNVVGQGATAALAPRSNFWIGYVGSNIRNDYFGGMIGAAVSFVAGTNCN